MKKSFLTILFIAVSASALVHSQDTLPNFTLKNAGNNRIIIGWVNNFTDIRQLSIQRSFDSLNFYKTILTVPDPTAIQNGYLDAKATNDHMFYKLYILLDKGVYLFSPAKRPVIDTVQKKISLITKPDMVLVNAKPDTVFVDGKPDAIVVNSIPDTVIVNGKPIIVPAKPIVIKIDNLHWGDSLATPNPNHTKPFTSSFTPSVRVYTHRDGYVRITLPDDEKSKKYSIKFFEDEGALLFELKEIKERDFKIDKTNFYHAGWFRFELYENGKLLEKNKVYLEKDF